MKTTIHPATSSIVKTSTGLRGVRRSSLVALAAFASVGTMLATGNVGGRSVTVGYTTTYTGSITVTKVVTGDGDVPQNGWELTLTSNSPYCNYLNTIVVEQTVGSTVPVVAQATIPGAGGTATFSYLPDAWNYNQPCEYTLTETPVQGWTPSFSPAGPYSPGTGNIAVTLTNSSPFNTTTTTEVPTTIEATTTTIPSLVPIQLVPTTTAAPTTTVAPTTAAPVTTAVPVTFATTLPTAEPAIEVLATNPTDDRTKNGSVKGAGLENEGDQALAYTGRNDGRLAATGVLLCLVGGFMSVLTLRKRSNA